MRHNAKWVSLSLTCALGATTAVPAEESTTFYVATNGRDAWSGRLPAPNAQQADGPFATLARARDAVRELKKTSAAAGPVTILIRSGIYYLPEPLRLTPEDSGSVAQPVVYAAYPGERPVISGGRPITGWRREGDLWVADVPGAAEGKWYFRQLFVGGERQIRARTPNFDPAKPFTGGWRFIAPAPGAEKGGFGISLVNIHTPGDTFAWDVDVPAGGAYDLWLYYGAQNKPWGRTDMGGRTTMQVGEAEPVVLQHLPDTGDWHRFAWSKTATLHLSAGKQRLRWTNIKGGGLNFDAFALCDDPAWKPAGTELRPPAAGKHLVVVHAEAYVEGKGKESRVEKGRGTARRDRFHFRRGDWQAWPRSPAPEIHIFPAWGWVNAILSVDHVDLGSRQVFVKNANCTHELRLGNRYFIENVFEALDQPGEWFLDTSQGRLYYLPKRDDFQLRGVVAPALDHLIDLLGDIEGKDEGDISAADGGQSKDDGRRFVEHITFRGLTFRHTKYKLEMKSVYTPDDGAVWLRRARNCVIDHCRFEGVGGYAVRMSLHSQDNRITRNAITEAGQGGVLLTGYLTSTQAHDNLIAGNTITHCGRIWKHVAGVYVTTGSRNRIAHNTITDMPRYGISLKSFRKGSASHDNVVEYNRLERLNLETNDTGAIETLGRDRENSGNIIRYNLILDVIGLKTSETGEMLTPYYTWGIYLDDYSSGTQVVGNIVARAFRAGAHVHLGFNNLFENNIFVDNHERQFECNGRDDMVDNIYRRNIVVWREGSLMRIRGGKGKCLKECDYNLYWMHGRDLDDPGPLPEPLTPAGPWSRWKESGHDQHSIIADPLFVDSARDDYRLQPESPAFRLGFRPVPIERIGAAGYEGR